MSTSSADADADDAAVFSPTTNISHRTGKDQTSILANHKTDLHRSSRFYTGNRRLGRQETIHIRLIWAAFLIVLSNMFIRPLTAGHTSNTDQQSDFNRNSLKNTELNLQSRYYDHHEVYTYQRLRRAAENEDSINGSGFAADPNEELNCTPRAVVQFPSNFMPQDFVLKGGMVFNILISIYMFLGLAIVCDDYFVPSLAQLRDFLHISRDISGATFMAIGSSIPELFTSIIGIIIAQSDVGVGTIAGSAVFNILFIMGCCAFATSINMMLSWWTVLRDSFVYIISVCSLSIVLIDERIYWYEALCLLLLYCLYIIILAFNRRLEAKAHEIVNGFMEYYNLSSNEKQPLLDNQQLSSAGYLSRNAFEASSEMGDPKKSQLGKTNNTYNDQTMLADIEEERPSSDSGEVNYPSTMTYPDTLAKKIFWWLMLPLKFIFYLTIPDCRRPSCHRFCACTFLLSILWIAILSYLMVWMATLAGDAMNVPDTVIGFTILATGTSIPDCLASYFVAKDGHADMAFANTLGSNIFDILVCLGIPWLIQASINLEEGVVVHSHGLTYSILILLITIFLFLASLILNSWTLSRAHGYFYLGLHAIIITIVCLYEMNYFGPLNPPPCPR